MSLTINKAIDGLGVHPFSRVADLIKNTDSHKGADIIDLTIGEPQYVAPYIETLLTQFKCDSENYRRYPPNGGTSEFSDACMKWVKMRFNLSTSTLGSENILPTAGAREALYQLGFLVCATQKSLIAMPVPHYAPYRASAIISGLSPYWMNVSDKTNHLPCIDSIPEKIAKAIGLFYLCTPSNPEGAVASFGYIENLLKIARHYNWIVVVDECYSELYYDVAPIGALHVAEKTFSQSSNAFENLIVINSLSKRSSAAGLRVGFVCGDKRIISGLLKLRSYCGGTTSLQSLKLASYLYSDESHVEDIRNYYHGKFNIARKILGNIPQVKIPSYGMFIRIETSNDEDLALNLWEKSAIKVVPSRYLVPTSLQDSLPQQYIRIAITHNVSIVTEACTRIKSVLLSSYTE